MTQAAHDDGDGHGFMLLHFAFFVQSSFEKASFSIKYSKYQDILGDKV
jgi:hypothetical protein